MSERFDWGWLFRTRCRAIASHSRPEGGGIRILLCDRFRWHYGECTSSKA